MRKIQLVKTRLHAGIWEGELHVPEDAETLPEIVVTHLDQSVAGYELTEDHARAGIWFFRFAVPPELLSDGAQTFVISDRESNETLASFTIIAGELVEDDIRAEMDLLRAELDMLKRAFRRHCIETGAN